MASENRKLLLIGATGYDRAKEGFRLDCVSWERIGSIQNARDYDVLLINLLSISSEPERKKVDWVRFNKLLDFPAATDILVNRGAIVVLGDPRFEIPKSDGTETKPFLDWTGATFRWDNQPGDTVKFNESRWDYREFEEYAKHLRKWRYSLVRCFLNETVFAGRWDVNVIKREGWSASVRVYAACSNRYGNPLAFSMHHLVGTRDQVKIQYGSIYFLPEISLDEDETLLIVLRDFCDAATELPEPEWVSKITVPGQKEIDTKIVQIEKSLAEQQAALANAVTERIKVRTCLKLLYEREYALEPVVRDILRELGATIEDPVEKNKEDGWIRIELAGKIYEGVLEIKSTKSDQFNEDGRRQLLDWIDRGRMIRGENYKGIFIGNSAGQKQRKAFGDRPDALSDSWKKAAKLSQLCALKSEELFFIYLLHKRGKVNLEAFWTKLFATDGIFDISPFLPRDPEQATT